MSRVVRTDVNCGVTTAGAGDVVEVVVGFAVFVVEVGDAVAQQPGFVTLQHETQCRVDLDETPIEIEYRDTGWSRLHRESESTFTLGQRLLGQHLGLHVLEGHDAGEHLASIIHHRSRHLRRPPIVAVGGEQATPAGHPIAIDHQRHSSLG